MSLSCFRCCCCYCCCHCHSRNCFCYCLCKTFDCNVLVHVIVVAIVIGVVIVIVVIVFAIVCSVCNQQDNLFVTGSNVNICAVTRNVLKPFGITQGPSLFIVFVVGFALLRIMFVDAVSIHADCRCNNVLGVYCKSNIMAYLFHNAFLGLPLLKTFAAKEERILHFAACCISSNQRRNKSS
jgi:hypothetical protein